MLTEYPSTPGNASPVPFTWSVLFMEQFCQLLMLKIIPALENNLVDVKKAEVRVFSSDMRGRVNEGVDPLLEKVMFISPD